jgi:hypothetical protein
LCARTCLENVQDWIWRLLPPLTVNPPCHTKCLRGATLPWTQQTQGVARVGGWTVTGWCGLICGGSELAQPAM